MENIKKNGFELEFYDSVDSMKTARSMQANKFHAMVSIAPDADNMDRLTMDMIILNRKEKRTELEAVIMNLRQGYDFAVRKINPETIIQACFLSSVNGKKKFESKVGKIDLNDNTDEGLLLAARFIEELDTKRGVIYQTVDRLKKKLITKLTYFFLTWKVSKKS